jgi:hypothetical protein
MYRSISFWAWLIVTNLITAAAVYFPTFDSAHDAGFDLGANVMTDTAAIANRVYCAPMARGDECGAQMLKNMRLHYCYAKHADSPICNQWR